jgi:signal transduction histidine kinase
MTRVARTAANRRTGHRTDVPDDLADEVEAVLSEALTNVARHARADRAEVSIAARSGTLTVNVVDDGVGIKEGGRRSGLRDLRERAERLGGELTVARGAGGGTRLEWRVPLRDRA